MNLYVFRHGQTDWNAEGRIQGHLDIPLNEAGRSQARALIAPLRTLGIQAMLSSDLSRASETATLIATPLGIPVSLDERLREVHLGSLQGMNREEIDRLYGKEFSSRMRHTPISDADIVSLGAESAEQVIARVREALAELDRRHPGLERVGVATHGGVLRRMVQHAEGDPGFPPPIANGVLYPFEVRRSAYVWRLSGWLPFSA